MVAGGESGSDARYMNEPRRPKSSRHPRLILLPISMYVCMYNVDLLVFNQFAIGECEGRYSAVDYM